MKLVFASNSVNKLNEIRKIILFSYEILSLKDIGCTEELPETGETLIANALQKARYVYEKYHTSCFADDTGLEVESLNGKPGAYSTRYAGKSKSAEDNIIKLLNELKDKPNRKAQFRTVIAAVIKGKEFICEGIVKGEITDKQKGENGFGYDPVFKPDGYDCTFAEMALEEKNKISHRAKALDKFLQILKSELP